MTHLPVIMATVRTAAEHIGGALYDLGVNDRDSALRRLYRAKAALEDAIGRITIEGGTPKHKTEAERQSALRYQS